ncbi:DUF4158 domain-containing protein [Polaromonas sp.]|uniref:DUF4158 domain-containing protein n=1 Tax=Polaromonas sp. TaxID=1869339 RepID=UPI002FC70A6F
MNIDSRRLSILSAKEVEALYSLPRFVDGDRRLYFDLSAVEREAVTVIHTVSVAVHLVLQLGYFKAKRQFFAYEPDTVIDDLRYIVTLYFPGRDVATIKAPSRP